MDILKNRPNVLFLIAVRKPDLYYKLLCIKKLLSDTYRQKVVRALSTYEQLKGYGICMTEIWRVNGKIHRENGPAFIDRYKHRILMEWCINGELHNENGPATMDFDYEGNISHEWYLNGEIWEFKDRTQYLLSKYSKTGAHDFGDIFG